jgi:uncharacterized membrane protein
MTEKLTFKQFLLTVLNGQSLGIIIALIPSALVNQLLTTFAGQQAWAQQIISMTNLAQSLLPAIAAFSVGYLFKFHAVDTGAIALAAFVASGVTKPTADGLLLSGTGIITNTLITITVASALVLLLQNRLGQFKPLISPLLVLVLAGSFGLATLSGVSNLQQIIGHWVAAATHLTPIVMGSVLAMIFAALVVSPLSSVGVATAISLAGVGAGAANAGIVVASFTLAWMGARINPLGGTLAHFMGSPKVQMANMLLHPKLFIPTTIGAGITGAIAALLQMQGTPFSAGFGFSGLIGPLTAWQTSTGDLIIFRVFLTYLLVPVILAYSLKWFFMDKHHFINETDVQLPDIS